MLSKSWYSYTNNPELQHVLINCNAYVRETTPTTPCLFNDLNATPHTFNFKAFICMMLMLENSYIHVLRWFSSDHSYTCFISGFHRIRIETLPCNDTQMSKTTIRNSVISVSTLFLLFIEQLIGYVNESEEYENNFRLSSICLILYFRVFCDMFSMA